MVTAGVEPETVYRERLAEVLSGAAEAGYAGYSKFDALNSPLLNGVTLGMKWPRILAIQLVKECPFHIRPLLGVQPSRNPKGIALFARAHLFLWEATGDISHKKAACALLDWLLENPSPNQKNYCWGYNFIWESPLFLQDRYEPNLVVTVFAGEALLHGYRATGERVYLDGAVSVARFINEDIPVLHDSPDERAIAYVLRQVKAAVLNNNVLAGAFLAKVARETGDVALRDVSTRLLAFTVNRRTDYGAWYYTHPSDKSHIRHDNYHTGGIVDGLLEYYEETGDERFQDAYWKGLAYYADNLFEADGAPRWMNDRAHPYDVHGAAQGIISFAKAARWDAAYLEQADAVAAWTLDNLYRPDRRDFVYRQGRLLTWNYSLMRWCNGWMARALGERITVASRARDTEDGIPTSPQPKKPEDRQERS